MRVIAGSAGGIRLDVPKTDVRPTMDRVKAAIFSSLGDRVIGAKVLDLFAGTGALGIEALSRGAAMATFVEENRDAVRTIECNLARAKATGQVRQSDVLRFLSGAGPKLQFDIIFADPPYDETKSGDTWTRLLLHDECLPKLLASEGVFVLEKRPGEALPVGVKWRIARQKKYGATEVLFLEDVGASDATPVE